MHTGLQPASILNQISRRAGIPHRLRLSRSGSSAVDRVFRKPTRSTGMAVRLLRLNVLQILKKAGVRWLPTQYLAGVGARRALVHCKYRTEWAKGLLRNTLYGQVQPPADDGCDVAYCVTLVSDRMPGRPGRRRFESQPEQACSVEGMHGRPTLISITRIAGYAATPRLIDQQTGEEEFRSATRALG